MLDKITNEPQLKRSETGAIISIDKPGFKARLEAKRRAETFIQIEVRLKNLEEKLDKIFNKND